MFNDLRNYFLIIILLFFAVELQSQNVEWFTMSNGLSTTAKAVAVHGNNVYVGGLFASAGGVSASRIAKWNGESWSGLSSGVNGEVRAIVVMGNDIYVGGNFSLAGDVPVNNIAKWDGTSWSSVGTGVNDIVLALAVEGNNLYAGGFFTQAGGVPASRIAKWDGTSWQPLGGGVDNEVNSIAVSGNNVYVGGFFNNAGGSPAGSFAKWNGSSWSGLGTGVNGYVRTIIVIENEVYIGGSFSTVNGISAQNIAKWDGNVWHPIGQGLSGSALTFKKLNNELYVGGMFTQAGGIPANRIAKYNLTNGTWSAIGNGTSGGIDAMDIYQANNSIVIAGAFGSINNNVTANYIARFRDLDNPVPVELSSFSIKISNGKPLLLWTTSSETNNSGFEVQRTARQIVSSPILEFETIGFVPGKGTTTDINNYSFVDEGVGFGNYLYRLKQIDYDGSFNFSDIVEIDLIIPQEFSLEQNYPNPFNPTTTIKFSIPASVETFHGMSLRVYDVLGNEVAVLIDNELKEPGVYNYQLSIDNYQLTSGVYFYQLRAGNFVETRKMILLK